MVGSLWLDSPGDFFPPPLFKHLSCTQQPALLCRSAVISWKCLVGCLTTTQVIDNQGRKWRVSSSLLDGILHLGLKQNKICLFSVMLLTLIVCLLSERMISWWEQYSIKKEWVGELLFFLCPSEISTGKQCAWKQHVYLHELLYQRRLLARPTLQPRDFYITVRDFQLPYSWSTACGAYSIQPIMFHCDLNVLSPASRTTSHARDCNITELLLQLLSKVAPTVCTNLCKSFAALWFLSNC